MKPHPNVRIPSTSTLSLIGEAPYEMIFSDEKSAFPTPGTIRRAWIIAGTRSMCVTLYCPMPATIVGGSNSG